MFESHFQDELNHINHHLLISSVQRRTVSFGLIVLLAITLFGCNRSTGSRGANSGAAPTTQPANINAEANPQTDQAAEINFKEPERYGVAVTISAQDVATGEPSPMATQQFGFAKIGADRRWAFNLLAPLGQVVYLEKSGLRYLVFFDHKQYIELSPDTLSFSINRLSPFVIAEHLKPRMQFEKRDPEPLNGRVVIKYRLTGASDTQVSSDGAVFVDAETGLPLRTDLQTSPKTGITTRVIVEARELQLNPDRSQFDVPAGMKKITTQEAKQQIEEFAGRLHLFVEIVAGTSPASAAIVDQPAVAPSRRARRVR
jgi:hypothetical protein